MAFTLGNMARGGGGGGAFGAANQAANQQAQSYANTPAAVQAAHQQFSQLDPVQQAQWLQTNPQMGVAFRNAGLVSADQWNSLMGGNNQGTVYNTPNTMQPFQWNGAVSTPQQSANPGSGLMGGTGAGAAQTANADTNQTGYLGYGQNPNTNYGSYLTYGPNGQIMEGVNAGGMATPGDQSGATPGNLVPWNPNGTAAPNGAPAAAVNDLRNHAMPLPVGAGNGRGAGPGSDGGVPGTPNTADILGPGQGITGPQVGTAQGGSGTLGGMATGNMGLNTPPVQAGAGTSITDPNMPEYPLNVGAYLNPGASYAMDQANKALQGTYAGAGNLLSGPAMKGITDYNQNMALNNYWNPAVATAQQQQGTGIGLGEYNQNFGYQQQLANQTIPFQQQMQLAGLGLQGTQGAQQVQNLLATLLSQNALGAGQAAGTGTIGGANTITQMIQNMLQNYLGQNTLNQVLQAKYPQATTGGG
jgi:hypothetical protein